MKQPTIVTRARISPIWLIPLFAAFLALGLMLQQYYQRGAIITITFKSANGIEAGVTRIKALDIDVGEVIETRLNDSMDGVEIVARIKHEAKSLLKKDSRFWVVKPRIGASGISGLGTLFSGAYIEITPGKAQESESEFVGLEDPPVTAEGTPGIRIQLTTDRLGSIKVGNKIWFRGFPVGQVETVKLDPRAQLATCTAFINAPYHELVTETTRFWNDSGVAIQAGSNGINIRTSSLDSLLLGGIAFDTPPGMEKGKAVAQNAAFKLYPDLDSVQNDKYRFGTDAILLFNQSVRGLSIGANVEFHGIVLGKVTKIDTNYQNRGRNNKENMSIPVTIRLQPALVGYEDSEIGVQHLRNDIFTWIKRGLQASLKTSNLLTGSLFVDLDYKSGGSGQVTLFNGHPSIPTQGGSMAQLEQKLNAILDKIEKLPIDSTITQANQAIQSANKALTTLNKTVTQASKTAQATTKTVDQYGELSKNIKKTVDQVGSLSNSLNTVLNDPHTRKLPAHIQQTLTELQTTIKGLSPNSTAYQQLGESLNEIKYLLKDIQPVAQTLKTNPNALIFNSSSKPDPIPAGQNTNPAVD